MPRSQRQLLTVLLVILSVISLLLLVYYMRQRLFTQTEPIVLKA